MAKKYEDTAALCSRIVGDAKAGVFAPVYLLMGEEPYYPDIACEAIIKYALADEERDFNQSIYYGLDTDALTVASEARMYPMMAERRLVVLKEAQMLRSFDEIALYCQEPMESTVLVILMRGAKMDKRLSAYKAIDKVGVVLDSQPLRIDDMDSWIRRYYGERGLEITPEAASLLAEYAGTDLGKIAVETDKMLKNLPEGTKSVRIQDIESNIGITRQWSIFELTKVLSSHDTAKALRIASHYSQTPKFAMAAVTPMLFNHFQRILKLHALLMKNPRASSQEKASLLGVNPFFVREYDMAVRVYPLRKCQAIISMLEDYDYMGKGGDGGIATQEDLFMELISKILAI